MEGHLSTPNGKISQKNFYGFPRTFPPEDTLSRLFSACGRTFPANSARKERPRPPQNAPPQDKTAGGKAAHAKNGGTEEQAARRQKLRLPARKGGSPSRKNRGRGEIPRARGTA